MAFESVNELDKFNFEDCVVNKIKIQDNQVLFEVDALIVEPKNSQNTNFTRSYADTTTICLRNGKVTSLVKEGFRYFDADGKLLSETKDKPINPEDFRAFCISAEGSYMFSCEKGHYRDGVTSCTFEFEFNEDTYDTAGNSSYEMKVEFTDAIVSWERYLNRVQQ